MSENLKDLVYKELIINTVDLYNYFVQNNYSYSDVSTDYSEYTAKFITNRLKTLINDVSVNYILIKNILTQLITAKTAFTNFFKSSDDTPFYTYIKNQTESSFFITINDTLVPTHFLIKIKYVEAVIPTIEDTAIADDTTTTTTTTIDCSIIQSPTGSFFNNDILFAKSLNTGSNIFEQIKKKNIWSLVTLVNDLDITYTAKANCNIVIQITAGITITSNMVNSYSWGLFNVDTKTIDKSSLVVSNTACTVPESYNSIKSIFFHIGAPVDGTYNYKWIHKDDTGLNNIQIDSSYPITIIAWKIHNQINDINISYMQHLSQKINDLHLAYKQLSSKVDAL